MGLHHVRRYWDDLVERAAWRARLMTLPKTAWKKGANPNAVPGQPSTNPAGPGKMEMPLRQTLRALLNTNVYEAGKKGRPHRKIIAEKLVEMAEAGNLEAIKLVADRVDGKPVQQVGGIGGGPIAIRHVDEWRPVEG